MSEIIHNGIVHKRSDNNLEIEIVDGAACSTCSQKGACTIADSNGDLLPIQSNTEGFKEGDSVSIHLSFRTAFSALFWGYLFPFIILMTSVVVFSLFFEEGIAGLLALGLVLVYYLIIYLNNKYFSKKFELEIKHQRYE